MTSFAAGAAGPGLEILDEELGLEEERTPESRELERESSRGFSSSYLREVHKRHFALDSRAADSESQHECCTYSAMVVEAGGEAPDDGKTIGPQDEIRHLDIDLYQSESGEVYATGLKKCGSPWSCPSCAEEIARRHACVLEKCIESWRARGKEEYLLTLTLPHSAGDDLEDVQEALREAWSYATNGTAWTRLEDQIELRWYARGFDSTHSWRNGWHPHFHVLLGVESELTEEQVERFLYGWSEDGQERDGLYTRWNRAVEALYYDEHGELQRRTRHYPHYELPEDHQPAFGTVSEEHGVRVSSRRKAGWYVAKMGLSSETVRMDVKEAAGDHRTPRQILADFAAQERERDAELWREWCRAMKGQRKLYRSKRLMELIRELEEEPEVVQEELELEKEREEDPHLVQIQGKLWDKASRQESRRNADFLRLICELLEKCNSLEYLRAVFDSYVEEGEVRLDEAHSRIWWKR